MIAAALGYSYDYNTAFVLPTRTLNESIWPNYFKGKFVDSAKYTWMFKDVYREPSHSYTKIPYFENSVLLEGYFQSYMYFADHLDNIRSVFGFTRQTIRHSVSLHVRRGDYLKFPTKHPLATLDYFFYAVQSVDPNYRFFVFSDDIFWCKENLYRVLPKGAFITFVEPGDPVEDMKWMAACEHNICSNSSYSVMAAILNKNPDKRVICPHEDSYFGVDNRHLDVSTMMPPEWKRIKF
jgi:hypothetical protein